MNPVALFALSLLMLLFLPVVGYSEAMNTIVYVDPPLVASSIGETLPINVTVANVTDLYAWSFQACYESEVLNASYWTPGPNFRPSDTVNITVVWTDNYNETHGMIQIDCTFLGNVSTFNGTAVLATVYFQPKSLGSTVLHLQNTLLLDDSDPWPQPIVHTTADGQIGKAMQGDINQDGQVNILDITIVAKAFGSRAGDQRWNSSADLNNNGIINILDITIVAKEFGRKSVE